MDEKRTELIGARFTKKEKLFVENYINSRNITLTDFLREAVFSHINSLKDNVGDIDVSEFLITFDDAEQSIKRILRNIQVLRESLDQYGIKKLSMEFKNQPLTSKEKEHT